jgi:transcription antitermination factor NusG
VSDVQVHLTSALAAPAVGFPLEDARWFAIHTVARHEKRVDALLQEKRVDTFLPLLRQVRQWSDRRSTVEVPLFSCYVFVNLAPTPEERTKILHTPGVLGFVGNERQGTPIPTEQIESLQTALSREIPCVPYPYLHAGTRVRIRGGALNGVEGILVQQREDRSLVVSVELLQRSVAIRVEGYDVEVI